jgi:hypothetical protein
LGVAAVTTFGLTVQALVVPAAFLAVPLLIAAKVCFDAVPRLRGWGQILGRRRSFRSGVEWLEDRHPLRARRRARPVVRSTA